MAHTVRISGIDWRVDYCKKSDLLKDSTGNCLAPHHPNGPAVLIHRDAPERKRFSALCHEFIHAAHYDMFDEDWVADTEEAIVAGLWKAGARWPRPLVRPRKITRADVPSSLVTRLTKLYRQCSGNALCEKWSRRAAYETARAMLTVGVKWPN